MTGYADLPFLFEIIVTIQHPRLGMLCIPRCGAVRGAARLVRMLNNYKLSNKGRKASRIQGGKWLLFF
jgi:hypothetical protein